MLRLRDYQLDVIDRARHAIGVGVRRLLLQLPTGAGKTCLVAHMLAGAASRKKCAWFCVHRRELLEQSVQTFIEAADIRTGIISNGYPTNPQAPVQVCSVPSLKTRAGKNKAPDMIVWDECQHLASGSWSVIAQMFPHALHIGLTATPQRLDGRGLAPYFDELICGPSTAELIAQGYLSPYTLYAPPNALSLKDIKRTGGDYNKHELAETMEATTVVGDAVSHYREHCAGSRALVFAWSLDASRRIAAQFVAAGVPAAHVDGETPRHERTVAMKAFRAGTIRVLCNVDLFGEGLDVPAVDAVFLLRPTQSLGLYLQQVGRGLRTSPGKTAVKIFDHVNNWERHGLPDDDREWKLEGRERRPRDSSAMGRRCEQCFGVSPIGCKACRYCGHLFPIQQRDVEQVDGRLQVTDPVQIREFRMKWYEDVKKCKTLKDYQRAGRAMGYKPGWAWHAYYRHQSQAQDIDRVTAYDVLTGKAEA